MIVILIEDSLYKLFWNLKKNIVNCDFLKNKEKNKGFSIILRFLESDDYIEI